MSAMRSEALAVVRDQLTTAANAKKCHSCGCFHQTVTALRELPETAEIRDLFFRAWLRRSRRSATTVSAA